MYPTKYTLLSVTLAFFLLFSVSAAYAQAVGPFEWTKGISLVFLSTDDIQSQVNIRNSIEGDGGRIALIFPPKVLIGWFSEDAERLIVTTPGVAGLYRGYVDPASLGTVEASTLQAVQFFNSAVTGEIEKKSVAERQLQQGDGLPPDGGLIGDAFPHPDVNYDDYADNLRRAFSREGSKGIDGVLPRIPAEVQGNSDNMVGTTTVTIFFVESNGTIDPNQYTWTSGAQTEILTKAASGLAWWVSQASSYGKTVSFTIRNYPATDVRCQTGYEPILHTSTEASTWISEIMGNFGYTSGNHITRVTAYNTWAKTTYGTTNAYSAFVEYNPSPAPAQFTNGYSAWAYLGGPYTNLLYRSFGWSFDVVFPHESGHIFWACDEYYQSGYGGCTSCGTCSHGVVNGNCEYCNPQSVPCMMKANSPSLCTFTPGQLGWISTPILAHYSHTIIDPLGNGNAMADPGETVSMDVSLRNYGSLATGISATLSSTDPYITITSNSSTYPDIALGGSGSSYTDYVFSSSPSTPVGRQAIFKLTIHAAGYDTTSTFTVLIGETPVLLVDDDGGATYETYYQTAIASTGLNYYLWRVKTSGSPTLAELKKHRITVWFTSDQTEFTLNGTDEANLTSYLNWGGTLFLSSQEYLTERFATFANDLLRVSAFLADVQSPSEVGVSGDPISNGMNLTMSYPFYNYNDDVTPGLNASGVFLNNTGVPGAIRFPSRGTAPYKSVFMAFPFEAISNQANPNNQNTVMKKIFDWLLLPQDYQPPAVSLISPNGSENWEVGTTHEIRWAAQDSSGVDSISIFYSIDGGFTYPDTITMSTPNDSSYTWIVPDTPSDSVRVKVIAYDKWLNTAEDASNSLFSIKSPVAVLENSSIGIPAKFYLAQNHPNPFSPATGVSFGLPVPARVSLKVYSVAGKLISSLVDGNLDAGVHNMSWNGATDDGKAVPSGIYFLKIKAGAFTQTIKMVLLR